MIDALIGGRIYGTPTERVASSGVRYTTAKVRVPTRAAEALFVNVIAFDDQAISALLALSDRDSVAISGELTPKVYVPKQGEPRPSLDLLAHSVISPYHVARRRKAVRAHDSSIPGELPFDDRLPPGDEAA